MIRMIIKNFYI